MKVKKIILALFKRYKTHGLENKCFLLVDRAKKSAKNGM